MALKKLPGGVVVETTDGARLSEDAGVNLEAIHRQLSGAAAAALEQASKLRYAVTRDHTIILDVEGATNVTVDQAKYTFQIGD